MKKTHIFYSDRNLYGNNSRNYSRCAVPPTPMVPVGGSASHCVCGERGTARAEAKGVYWRQGTKWDHVVQCELPIFPTLLKIEGSPSVLFRPTAHYSLPTANSLTYTFSAKEKDSETGLSYFGSRYYSSDLSVWLSVDPMAGKYPSLSPYVYCANNPVKLVDPDGEEIDWVENLTSGEVIWMQDVACQENTPDGYRYIGAKYDLPDGSGRLGNVSYNTYGGNRYLGDNESAMAEINIEFIPTDSKKSYNWVQTYSTNFFTDSNGEFAFDRITDSYSDYVDCGAQSTDPTISCFFNPYLTTTTLSDGNRRFVGSGKEIGMHFTSSVVNSSDNSRVVSIKWGYSISADGYASFIPPTITSSIDNFHKTAIQYAK